MYQIAEKFSDLLNKRKSPFLMSIPKKCILVLIVVPGVGPWDKLGSLLVIKINRFPLGSQAKAVTVSNRKHQDVSFSANVNVQEEPDSTFDFNHINGERLVSDPEQFKVAVGCLFRLCVPVNFYADIITVGLPVYLGL
jgi:hypothetical protein